jgi:hypothetical protein
MTALGWMVVLGLVGAYALLWVACWNAMKKGAQEWSDTERTPSAMKCSADNGGRELIRGGSADRSEDDYLVSPNRWPRLRLASRRAGHLTFTQDVDRPDR